MALRASWIPRNGSHDRLAVEQGGHLAFAQRVPLDRQGALYRTDAVDAPQPEILSDAGSLGPPDSSPIRSIRDTISGVIRYGGASFTGAATCCAP